ncbi:hypothetical protein [Streptomyces pseudogriseolus]|uniref:hypothetical protein n=1 Tax=Streptomyces pseudogriseolus TaxID=36817 RepID=UPI000A3BBA9D
MPSPELLQRYADAPDLPAPVHAVGTPDGTVTAAWCPTCHDAVTGYDWDRINTTAALLTLTGCGHTFRTTSGQTIAVVRTAAV